MKGLLLKDFYALKKQFLILLIWAAAFSMIPGSSMSGFVIVYAAMLPVSALAFDEKSKWNKYASMLPYSGRDIVLGKYLFGYVLIIFAVVLSALVQFAAGMIKQTPFDTEPYISIAALMFLATLLQSINLPFMLRFGVEKGRLLFILISMIIVVFGLSAGKTLISLPQDIQIGFIPVALICAAIIIVINIVSILISIRIYNKAN